MELHSPLICTVSGIEPFGRTGVLLYNLRERGWKVIVRKKGTLSVTLPWKVIYLSSSWKTTTVNGTALLAHEAFHVMQMGEGWRKWLWCAKYILWPPFRRRQEIEARGMSLFITRKHLRWFNASGGGLHSLQSPYYIPFGTEQQVAQEIETFARMLNG